MPLNPQQIKELEAYRGTNPIPADFDDFWSERMAEADDVALDYEIVPSRVPSFDTCDFLDLWFRGMGGARLYARYLRPRSPRPLPVVLRFHGYPGRTRSWLENASFAGMGFADATMDNPGQGGRSEDGGGFAGTTVSGHLTAGLDGEPKDMYYVRLHQDIRILCRIVRELPGLDAGRVCVYGDSQGGGVGLATCALNPDLIGRAGILYPFWGILLSPVIAAGAMCLSSVSVILNALRLRVLRHGVALVDTTAWSLPSHPGLPLTIPLPLDLRHLPDTAHAQ